MDGDLLLVCFRILDQRLCLNLMLALLNLLDYVYLYVIVDYEIYICGFEESSNSWLNADECLSSSSSLKGGQKRIHFIHNCLYSQLWKFYEISR